MKTRGHSDHCSGDGVGDCFCVRCKLVAALPPYAQTEFKR